jgi:hypothetical protein
MAFYVLEISSSNAMVVVKVYTLIAFEKKASSFNED